MLSNIPLLISCITEDLNQVISISINTEDAAAYYNRGHVYKRLGKYREAENDFQTAEKLGYKN